MKRYWFGIFLLAMLLGFRPGQAASAKPSDLPADNQIQCPDCGEQKKQGSVTIGLDLFSGRLSVHVEMNKTDTEVPLPIDTITPAYVEELLKHVSDVLLRIPSANPDGAAARDLQAGHLFQVAEWCTRRGDFGSARACYQQVHMLTPTSRMGRLAIDRLSQIEERLRDSAEEAEEPMRNASPEEAFRSMRNRSIPLGLVEISY